MQTDEIAEASKSCAALLAVEPANKDAHYTLAVIRWMDAYREAARARRKAGMQAGDAPPIRDAAIRDGLRTNAAGKVEEGHRAIERALYRTEAYFAASETEARGLLARADQRMQAALQLRPGPGPAGRGRVSARETPPPKRQ